MAKNVTIRVDAKNTLNPVSPLLTGACIEDVNHEIYGGLYSQMIFGESFQEPASVPPVKGFTAYGGRWVLQNDELHAAAGDGPKLVSTAEPFADGVVSVDIMLPDGRPGVAGIVVRLTDPAEGADAFSGYEVSLDADRKVLVLGRHRRNWEHLRDVPCEVPVAQWIRLEARLRGPSLEIVVDGRPVLTYEDTEHPLAAGTVALRTWRREAIYRNLTVQKGGDATDVKFEPETEGAIAGVSGMWTGFVKGTAKPVFLTVSHVPFVGRQAQRMTFLEGVGEVGVENRGLNRWGMNWVAGKEYDGRIYARCDKPVRLTVSAIDSGGNALSTRRLDLKPWNWRRLDFTLVPSRTERNGSFTIALNAPGSVDLGYVYLEPGNWGRYRGLPVRADIAEGLKAQNLTVMRYGGSMVNAPEYRWKNMTGPRDERHPYKGTWYPYSTNGWGIADFLDLCDWLGVVGIPAFNMDETPEDMADFVEYANARTDTVWGRKRVTDGHPSAYRLKYIELGNEEAVDEAYWQRFKPLAEAIWAKAPDMTLIVGDFVYEKPIKDPFNFDGAPRIRSLAAHKKILDFAKEHGKPVWFDIHIWNERPHDPEVALEALRTFIDRLAELSPGADFKVVVFEENANAHDMGRALAHAKVINDIQRIGEKVPMLCAANCLQPDGQNDNGWDQGMLFFNPSSVWPQPPYYVTQILAKPALPWRVAATVEGGDASLDVTVRRSENGKTLQLQVVNLDAEPIQAGITVSGFGPFDEPLKVIELKGELAATNTADNPKAVAPTERELTVKGEDFEYTFPGHSLTVLRATR
jgi:hypothetical protein